MQISRAFFQDAKFSLTKQCGNKMELVEHFSLSSLQEKLTVYTQKQFLQKVPL